MKKGYLGGVFKAFGIIPVLVLSIILVVFSYYALNPVSTLGDSFFNVVFTKASLATIFVGLALIGFVNLKSINVEFLDYIRITSAIGSIGAVVVSALSSQELIVILTYVIVLIALLAQIVVRVLVASYKEHEKFGIKSYTKSLANSFNPLVLSVLAIILGVCFNILNDKLLGLVEEYALGISLAIVLATLLISSCKENNKVTILDAFLVVFFIASVISIIYSLNDLALASFNAYVVMCLATLAALACRAASYKEDDEVSSSRFKMNCYYSDLYSKHDVSISMLLGLLVSLIAVVPAFFAVGYSNNFVGIGLPAADLTKISTITNYVSVGVCFVLLILLLVFRELKSTVIKPIDRVINILGFVSLFTVCTCAYVLSDVSNNFKLVTNDASLLVSFIVLVFVLVLSLSLQIVRYIKYTGIEADLADDYKEEQIEATDDAVTTEAVEQNTEAESPAFEQGVEEEIVYVDEDGNEISPDDITILEAEPVVQEEVVEEQVIYVDEDGNEISPEELVESDDDDEDIDDDIDDDYEVEDEEVLESVEAKEKGILMPEVTIVDENGTPKKIKRKFNTRMMFAPYEAKEYYNEIKNYLTMYRAKGRYSSRCEAFRYKGLVAKVALAGKSIKVCLAIDPQSLVDSKYHFKDVSQKRQYEEVPTMIKIRSPRGLKYFKELVDIMMAARGVKPKRNYQPINFMPQLIPNGEAILAILGMSTDYLYPTMNVRSIPEEMPDDLIDYLPVIQGEPLDSDEEVEAPIYLDTLCNHFIDGDEITIETLKELHIINRGNVLRIKARGTLDRKLIIYAEYFDPDALKMLMCTNCTVIKIIR